MTTERWLSRDTTARYLGVSTDAPGRLVRQGRVPKPVYFLGPRSPRWDRLALDELSSAGKKSVTDPKEAVAHAITKILNARRTGRSLRKARRDND